MAHQSQGSVKATGFMVLGGLPRNGIAIRLNGIKLLFSDYPSRHFKGTNEVKSA